MEVNMENKSDLIKQTVVFLAIVFGATYILYLLGYLSFGNYLQSPTSWTPIVMLIMLIPAMAAIISLFIFKPLSLTGKTITFFSIFGLYLLSTIAGLAAKNIVQLNHLVQYTSLITMALSVIGFVSIIVLNLKKEWRDELKSSRLYFGRKTSFYLYFCLAFIALITVNAYLNSFFGLGAPVKEVDNMTLLITIIQSFFVNGAVFGWALFFGEEYGWRVYLQDRMIGVFGRVKGVVLVGIIWGLWHAPIIAMGFHYPGRPVLGVFTFIISTIVIGIYYSYAVFKTGSVWIAVLLHMITNIIWLLLMMYIAYSTDPIFSFGIGVYGIAFLTIPALWMLKSDAFKDDIKELQNDCGDMGSKWKMEVIK
jgi:membrane protease YdiL (CAAX protease family)